MTLINFNLIVRCINFLATNNAKMWKVQKQIMENITNKQRWMATDRILPILVRDQLSRLVKPLHVRDWVASIPTEQLHICSLPLKSLRCPHIYSGCRTWENYEKTNWFNFLYRIQVSRYNVNKTVFPIISLMQSNVLIKCARKDKCLMRTGWDEAICHLKTFIIETFRIRGTYQSRR